MNIKENLGIKNSAPRQPLDIGGNVLVDDSTPLLAEDTAKHYVVSGLTVTYFGNYFDLAPGIAYNVCRFHLYEDWYQYVSNTGAAHTEYLSIDQESNIVLSLDARTDDLLPICDISVDSGGNISGTTDVRPLDSGIGGPSFVADSGSITIAASGNYIPAKGWWNFLWDTTYICFQVYVSGAWRGGAYQGQGTFWCDGTNMRLYNSDSSNSESFFYQKLL